MDAGAVQDAGAVHELIEEIRDELGQAGIEQALSGIVAACFLGPPYRVHVLDFAGRIVEHYEAGRSMPDPFERARSLALHPEYLCVEVYGEGMVAIRSDGTSVSF